MNVLRDLLQAAHEHYITAAILGAVAVMIAVIKLVGIWVKVAAENRSVTTATIIAGLLRDKEKMADIINELRDRLDNKEKQWEFERNELRQHMQNCEEASRSQRNEIDELKRQMAMLQNRQD